MIKQLRGNDESIFYNSCLLLVFTIGILLTIFVSVIFYVSSTPASAISAHSDLTLKISPVLSLSLSNCDSTNSSTLNLSIDPTPNGSFKSNCQTTNIHTNTPGYSLTIASSTSTLNYLNPTTVTTPPTINSTTNTITFPNILTNDTWGFAAVAKPNFDTTYEADNPNNKYAALPTTNTTIYQTDQYPLPQTNHTFYYATRLTPDTMAGTYAATITYTAVAVEPIPPVTYPLVENGATFQSTTTNINRTCSALPIYPAEGSTIIMTDNRNNQQYRVRRLQDGRCWMIDNLKLELTNNMILTPDDTNVTENTTIYFTQDGTSTGTPLTGMTGNWTTSGYMTRDGTNSSTSPNYDVWRQADPSGTISCVNNIGLNTANVYNPSSKTSCGYLYNWYTAVAGSKIQDDGPGYTAESICPAGWHLPYSTNTNDFAVLNGYMAGLGTSSESELYFTNWLPDGAFEGSLSGYYNAMFSNQSYSGHYWSGHVYSIINADYLSLVSNKVNPGTINNGRNLGYGIRCTL